MDAFRQYTVDLIARAKAGDVDAGWMMVGLLPRVLVANVDAPELFEHAGDFFAKLLSVRSNGGAVVSARDLAPAFSGFGILARTGRPARAGPPDTRIAPEMQLVPHQEVSTNAAHRMGVGDDKSHQKLLLAMREGDVDARLHRREQARALGISVFERWARGDRLPAKELRKSAPPDVLMDVRQWLREVLKIQSKRASEADRLWQTGKLHGDLNAGWELVECLSRALDLRAGRITPIRFPDGTHLPVKPGRPEIGQAFPTLFGHAADFFGRLACFRNVPGGAQAWADMGVFSPLGICRSEAGNKLDRELVIEALMAREYLRRQTKMSAADADELIRDRFQEIGNRQPATGRRVKWVNRKQMGQLNEFGGTESAEQTEAVRRAEQLTSGEWAWSALRFLPKVDQAEMEIEAQIESIHLVYRGAGPESDAWGDLVAGLDRRRREVLIQRLEAEEADNSEMVSAIRRAPI